MHSENQNCDQTEIHDRHRPALNWCDFIITSFFFSALTKYRITSRERSNHHQPDNEVRELPAKPKKHGETRQPKPARESGDDPPTVEHAHRRQVKQIQKVTEPGEREENWNVGKFADGITGECTDRTEHRPADSDASF